MKISIVMPSYLGVYPGAASNRVSKFKRAVNSVLKQTYRDWELIIVSDGCHRTNDIYRNEFSKDSRITLVDIEKQDLFSGDVRQAGINICKGDLICFLDSDDTFGVGHIEIMRNNIKEIFSEYDWFYYNDYIKVDDENSALRNVEISEGLIGTSSICFKRSMNASWSGCNGYGHDWKFIQRLKAESSKFKKIYGLDYYVHHVSGLGIDI